MRWKQPAFTLFLSTLLLAAAGCGDDDATGPVDSGADQRLVAQWQFASADLGHWPFLYPHIPIVVPYGNTHSCPLRF